MNPSFATLIEDERRRNNARERAQRSRDAAKTRSEIDGALVEALAGLIQGDGRVDAKFAWRDVLKAARDRLEAGGYSREVAIEVLRARICPDVPASQ